MADLPIYITPEGHARIRAELEHLWKVERPRVTAEVAAAAALGDRSENAEYIYGKKRLREIDRRLEFLAKRIERMHVVHPDPSKDASGKVAFGAWVVVEDEDGERHVYRLVGADESDADAGHISMDSPMGRALLGKEVDDEVLVHRPRGPASFTILSIHHGAPPKKPG
ncbi:MAG TPA: transcription elongation factor GreB [Nannocystaceae bacterium]|nr:transcription elongation factor GreB [Nannocystaceae bacterium]